MAKSAKKDGLDLDEDRGWQDRLWKVQRVGWALMLLFLIAAILGATGSGGFLATASAETGGATIHYPRIARWQAAADMIVELPPSQSGKVEFELSDRLIEAFGVETVSPTPSAVVATGGGHRFTFDVGPGGGRKTIVFHLRAMQATLPLRGEARLGEAPPARLDFIVLP